MKIHADADSETIAYNRSESCPDLDQLKRLASGSETQPGLDRFAEHLNTCDRCGRIFDALLRQDLQQLRGNAPSEGPQQADESRARETASPLTGMTEFGARFQILEKLGQGGMGDVYKCFDRQLNRVVAVKTIRPDRLSPKLLERLQREARIQAGLNYPNIVPIYDVGLWDGVPIIAMEFLAGGSLKELLYPRPLAPKEAARLLAPIARALGHAHSQQVLHRDLKPSNILFTSLETVASDFGTISGTPKIADFGLAKNLEEDSDLSQSEMIIGTPSYLAPEAAAGGIAALGQGADIYSFGVVLYESLTGHPPFVANSVGMLLAAIQTLEPVSPRKLVPGVNKDIETICLKCLEKEPARRYPSALAIAEDLERFIEGRAIVARPIGRVQKVWRWCRRNAQAAAALAVAVVSIVAMVGSAIWFGYLQADLRKIAEQNGRMAMEQARQARQAELEARNQRDLAREQFVAGSHALHNIGNMLAVSKFKTSPDDDLKKINRQFQQQVLLLSDDYLKRPDLAGDSPHLLPMSIFNAARAHADLGHTDEAIRHYEWLLELIRKSPPAGPDNESYRFLATNGTLALSDLYVSRNQLEKAIALLEPFWRNPLNPQDNQPISTENDDFQRLRALYGSKLASLYMHANQPEKARDIEQEMLKIFQGDAPKP